MFGRRFNAEGDVNGDGYKDILVGARSGGDKYNGSAYLFFGNTKQNMDANCDAIFRGESPGDQMGAALDLFDINNDGFSDVIVGARYAKNGDGAVYIWWGGKDLDGNRPADIVLQGEAKSNLSAGEIVCGYFNNDNYGDILVGAIAYPSYPINDGRAYVFYGNEKTLMDVDCDYIFDPEDQTKRFGYYISIDDVNNDGYIDALIGAEGDIASCKGKAFLYYGPFATEDLQDKIKAQQEVVKEVEQELAQAKRELNDARKSVPSSTDPEKVSVGLLESLKRLLAPAPSTALDEVFAGLPESLRRFLTPELQQLHDGTVASLKDGSFTLRDETRKNAIDTADLQLSPYIDELRQTIEALESQDNKNDRPKEELNQLKEKLSWFKKVKYVPQEERETKKNILRKEMTRLRGN